MERIEQYMSAGFVLVLVIYAAPRPIKAAAAGRTQQNNMRQPALHNKKYDEKQAAGILAEVLTALTLRRITKPAAAAARKSADAAMRIIVLVLKQLMK